MNILKCKLGKIRDLSNPSERTFTWFRVTQRFKINCIVHAHKSTTSFPKIIERVAQLT